MAHTGFDRRRFLAVGLAAGLVGCVDTGAGATNLPDGTRIVLVRHMDRNNGNLSALGIARAEALVDAISDIPLNVIYTHGLQRNLDSAQPLADARGISLTLIESGTVSETLPGFAAGRSVIWVGNRGNLASIWEALALPGAPPLAYGEIAIIEVGADGRARVSRRNFGPPPAPEG